ncbi:MAG: DNA recombination protein RmuC [Candidatus Omnitrophica bacterium]|nr:DNA recombination protein RmuC [Candidatus Omnitrophota bacterium]
MLLWLGLGALLGISVLFLWVARREISHWIKDQVKSSLTAATQEFLVVASQRFATERTQQLGDLETERRAVDSTVGQLREQLEKYETLVRGFESDRDRKFGQLKNELDRVVQGNDQLHRTTANLVAVLGNSRIRGQWGQKMAEDILRFCGLQEGIHYHKEQEIVSGRPDYTFMLPDSHCLFMDVKFPLDNYIKFVGAREAEQPAYQEAFLRDVKDHVREMERRNYLSESERSVDYILIFIPNEQVYGLINEWEPGLMDECLKRKTILCGPWTLYAVVRIIWQAWEHYRYTQGVHDIVKAIDGFRQDYEKFKTRFEELGKLMEKTQEKYREISLTSAQRLDQKIQRIDEYRRSEPPPVALEQPTPSQKEDAVA